MHGLGHGQSGYTPTKQRHVVGVLEACRHGLKPKDWTHGDVLFIDCTAGSGYTKEGNEGSPFIINRFASENYQTHFQHLCCEKAPETYAQLSNHTRNLRNISVQCGDYTDLIPGWLAAQNVSLDRPAMGIVYCDANGAKDLIGGIDIFSHIAKNKRFRYMDFLFHWSLTAYNRNRGAGYQWADEHVLKVMDSLVSLKRYAYMRLPMEKHRWVLMHLLNTEKVNPSWRAERIVRYQEWRQNQVSENQLELFALEEA